MNPQHKQATVSGHTTSMAACRELTDYLTQVDERTYQRFSHELLAAKRIATYGAGREGLMMRAFTMRLMHLGLDAHCVGDMTTPPVGPGDLLLVSCGPGSRPIAQALLGVGREAGARAGVVTANPEGEAARVADFEVVLPGPTMDPALQVRPSALLMGSIFEAVELFFFDVTCVLLTERLGQELAEARRRHTNLE